MKKAKIIFCVLLVIGLIFPMNANAASEGNSDVSSVNSSGQVKPEVEYRSHVQDIGWQSYVEEGVQSGTTGRNLKIEAMNIKLKNNNQGINIKYSTYIQGSGWQKTAENGEQTGTTGKNLRMEAIKIWLEGTEEYSAAYRTHIQDFGWQEWVYDGTISGNLGDNKKIEAIEIKIVPKQTNSKMSVTYSSHVQDIGWQAEKSEYDISGTVGRNLKSEAVKIKLNNAPEGVSIKYKTYVENSGWQQWVADGTISGTTGKNLKLYGIRIKLEGTAKYTVRYRVHAQSVGWLDWVENGEIAGKISHDKKIEAIQISIIEKENGNYGQLGVEYYTYLAGNSLNENKMSQNGQTSGTTGQNRKVEAINIELVNANSNANIKYMVHVQDIGWMNWVNSGENAGVLRRGLKIEAIKIKLEGLDEYTVEYRVHVQDIGWTGWYIDGESAGTTGRNLKIEAIEIRIVPHYKRYYTGIDVSRWQGEINYDKLVATGKIDFMIPRIGWYSKDQSKFMIDVQFERNYKETTSRKIPIGAYVYSYAKSVEDARKEAQETVNYLKSTGQTKFDLPIFFDIEDDTQISLGREKISQMTIAFCEVIKSAGFKTGVYSYSYWLDNYMDLSMLPEDYNIWVADFGKSTGQIPSDIYKYSNGYDIWPVSYTHLTLPTKA